MAMFHYIGGAHTAQQEYANTITTTTSGHTYIFTLTDDRTGASSAFTCTLPAGLTTTTEAAAAFKAQYDANPDGLLQTLVVSVDANEVTFKSRTAGRPFIVASYTGTGTWGTTTVANTVVVANSGPNDFGCEGNWAERALPGAGDDWCIVGAASILYNTYQASTTFGKISTAFDFSGQLGGPGFYFTCGCTDLDVRGRGQVYINVGSSAITPIVFGSAQFTDNAPAVFILGSALTNITTYGGSVAIAPYQGQTSTVTTITNDGARLVTGLGVTGTTYHHLSGYSNFQLGQTATTINAMSGNVKLEGTAAITTLNQYEAATVANGSGTITTLNIKGDGGIDFTQSRTARTVTTMNVAGKVNYDDSVLTVTTRNDYKAGAAKIGPVPPSDS